MANGDTNQSVWKWINTGFLALILGAVGWFGSKVVELGEDVGKHDVRIGALENSETHNWLRADVNEIKITLRTVDDRLRTIEGKVK